MLHLELTSYAELIPGAAPLRIWETECRGIRLQQLEELIDFLLKRWEMWVGRLEELGRLEAHVPYMFIPRAVALTTCC